MALQRVNELPQEAIDGTEMGAVVVRADGEAILGDTPARVVAAEAVAAQASADVDALTGELSDHVASPTAHPAGSITYVAQPGDPVATDDVQQAIAALMAAAASDVVTLNTKVAKTGDTMTGNLRLENADLFLVRPANASGSRVLRLRHDPGGRFLIESMADDATTVMSAVAILDAGILFNRPGNATGQRYQQINHSPAGELFLQPLADDGVTPIGDYIMLSAAGNVALAGNALGTVFVPDAIAPTSPVRKSYADTLMVGRVAKTGDTMTGDLAIIKTTPTLVLDAAGGNDSATLIFKDGGVTRWVLDRRGVDGNLIFRRYSAAGGVQSDVLQLNVDGSIDMMSAAKVDVPTPATSTNAATKGYVDTAAGNKVAKTGDTMTGDLTITKAISAAVNINATGAAQPILTFQDDGITRWGINYNAAGGYLQFIRYNAAGVSQGAPIAIYDDGTVDFVSAKVLVNDPPVSGQEPVNLQHLELIGVLKAGSTMTGPLVLPANTAANQAARITAYDAATGRLAIGGVEMGNTGWRTITSWDAAGVVTGAALSASFAPRSGAPGYVRMKRAGAVTHIMIQNLQAAAALTAGVEYELYAAGVLPTTGWCDRPAGFESIAAGGGQILQARWVLASGAFRLTPAVAAAVGAVVIAGVDAIAHFAAPGGAWPTTLPGTQYTPPFTG